MPYIIDVADVPLTGPDPYSDDQKRKQLDNAEGKLEMDVNSGQEFSDGEIGKLHRLAVNAYATYLLAVGPAAPDSALAGHFADRGDRAMDFVNELQEIYEQAKESLEEGEEDADLDAGGDIVEGAPRQSKRVYVTHRDGKY